jgi:hypothetical protein
MTRILMMVGFPLAAVALFVTGGLASTNPGGATDPGSHARRGADDGPNHDANDDHGNDGPAHTRRGADDGPGHDAADDHGIDPGQSARRGADDGAGHDANDDRGGGGHGADDAVPHF